MDQDDENNRIQLNQLQILDRIVRSKIFGCRYWKEQCFGLTAESLVDRAIEVNYIGATYSGKPTPFICLIAKLLQINPERDVIFEFIKSKDYKYVNALALFYLRLTSKPKEIYEILELFYSDYRKLRIRDGNGNYGIIFMDEYVDKLLTEEIYFDTVLPRIPKRWTLEENGQLEMRKSELEGELLGLQDDEDKDKSRSRSKSKEKNRE